MNGHEKAPARRDIVEHHPLIRRLLNSGLPARDLLVAGSAPLLLHGCRKRINDLDVVARGEAWTLAQNWGAAELAPYQGGRQVNAVRPAELEIEIFDGWFPWLFDDHDVFDRAEIVSGVRFMSLANTFHWKSHLAREKDLKDLELIAKKYPSRFGRERAFAA
ncbi:hypothetical protein [Amycolatopsis vastitatis]|uniref:Uncharacterized protein n=1 Tax=Amycolatopsis vastitatis TaxID=1905142 RepID=A0A229SXY1_9PSEU|nr:hypothetical protein [Amycolatopsis vastitatis]OXM63997.1 hypothetical protein CF165_26940 [Amycolatopsis vastitatis]